MNTTPETTKKTQPAYSVNIYDRTNTRIDTRLVVTDDAVVAAACALKNTPGGVFTVCHKTTCRAY